MENKWWNERKRYVSHDTLLDALKEEWAACERHPLANTQAIGQGVGGSTATLVLTPPKRCVDCGREVRLRKRQTCSIGRFDVCEHGGD